MTLLEKVNSPQDVKKLNLAELETLAEEIRQAILNRDSKIGGHVGSNLAVVEATLALHYVFNSPLDKIVFDVSHQCYAHKLITGRQDGFLTDEGMERISGYTNPKESEHDAFVVGHTSTSVSLACGLAKARDFRGEKHNVIALIGDGSLSGGEAFEGLDNAALLKSNMIIVVNDNEMSIAENVGGLYENLRLLRETKGKAECNFFKALGFEYFYIDNGNSLPDLIHTFSEVKDTNKPTVIHMHTLKGKGYSLAEEHKETWHWRMPFNLSDGSLTFQDNKETYNSITVNYLIKKVEQDKKVVVINAATPGAVGLIPDKRRQLGQNFVDVGIAEEHAVAFSSGLAKGGCKPVYMVLSSFIQRAYDQLSQDLAINNNSAVILVFGGGISAADVTHLGCFDIPLISNVPNVVYLAPTTKEEYLAMLDWGIEQNSHPVVIRVPKEVVSAKLDKVDYGNLNVYQTVEKGRQVAFLGLGSFFGLAQKVAEQLKQKGVHPSVINPCYITGIDEILLNELKKEHQLVVTLEDGILDGGFGEKIARFYGKDAMKVLTFGGKKEFTDRVALEELYQRYHLTAERIVQDILETLKTC